LIRRTLPRTQECTYAVGVERDRAAGPVETIGTAFFVADGLVVTAEHVVRDAPARTLWKESRGAGPTRQFEVTEVLFADEAADFALLRVEMFGGAAGDPQPHLTISERELDEGEPVYSFGYPLTDEGPHLRMTADMLPEELLGEFIDSQGRSVPREALDGVSIEIPTFGFSPRVTSAICASRVAYESTLPINPEGERWYYAIDKALNYGNSGGPIVASETGRVHALCTKFQPVIVRQPGDREPITIPSLYGIVTRLTHPTIRAALEDADIAFLTD
jgi:serine protease Do